MFWLSVRDRIRCVMLSRVSLLATTWTIVFHAPLSMEFSRKEYWGDLPLLTPGDLPNQVGKGIKPVFLAFPALPCGFFTTSATWEARFYQIPRD